MPLRRTAGVLLVAAAGVLGAGTPAAHAPAVAGAVAVVRAAVPAPAAAPAPATTPVPATPVPATPVPVTPVPVTPAPVDTGWPALDAAVRRLPGHAAAPTRWDVSARHGHWGSTLLPSGSVTINPTVPPGRLDDVVRHEWAHVLQVRAYGGDVPRLRAELARVFGGDGTVPLERAADCMARRLGAGWTHYTRCTDPVWQAAAARLLAGAPA